MLHALVVHLDMHVGESGTAVLAVKGTLDAYMHLNIILLCFGNFPRYLFALMTVQTVVFIMQGSCVCVA